MRSIGFGVVALLSFGLALSPGLLSSPGSAAQGAEEKPVDVRTISTSGEAVVYAAPDEVIVNLGIETADADLQKAKLRSDAAGIKLLKAIKELGVEAKHIQTDNLDVSLRYQNDGLTISGYVVRRGYAVTLKDTKRFEALVETSLSNGANRLLGFEYRTTELRKLRDQSRQMAIKAAREKAHDLADALDCQVGAPRIIQEGGGNYGYWGSHWGWGGGGNAMAQNVAQAGPAGGEGGESMPLGQIAIRAQVSVTFDLVPFGK
jgi:uncharacterized protein